MLVLRKDYDSTCARIEHITVHPTEYLLNHGDALITFEDEPKTYARVIVARYEMPNGEWENIGYFEGYGDAWHATDVAHLRRIGAVKLELEAYIEERETAIGRPLGDGALIQPLWDYTLVCEYDL